MWREQFICIAIITIIGVATLKWSSGPTKNSFAVNTQKIGSMLKSMSPQTEYYLYPQLRQDGMSNQIMWFLIYMVTAHLTNRTLVLPKLYENINHWNPITASMAPINFAEHFEVESLQQYVKVVAPGDFLERCPAGLRMVVDCWGTDGVDNGLRLCNSFGTQNLHVSCKEATKMVVELSPLNHEFLAMLVAQSHPCLGLNCPLALDTLGMGPLTRRSSQYCAAPAEPSSAFHEAIKHLKPSKKVRAGRDVLIKTVGLPTDAHTGRPLPYAALHVRGTDYGEANGTMLLSVVSAIPPEIKNVYISSDDPALKKVLWKNRKFFTGREVFMLHERMHLDIRKGLVSTVEALVCIESDYFAGDRRSSWSGFVIQQRIVAGQQWRTYSSPSKRIRYC
mmetsp:Transcript_39358/g.70608  ORF Transcript_39358/g.70608 Transcript_39358/m.70608 type:complete len:392 (-) Transcript_39358:75-1250(-)